MENPVQQDSQEQSLTLEETLSQAQKLHELERPSAPLSLRFASRVLDGIFIYLLINAIDKFFQAINPHFENIFFLGYLDLFLRVVFLFVYGVLVAAEFGGTLGQLLLGLKVIDSNTGEKVSAMRICWRLLWLFATNVVTLLVASVRKDGKGLHDVVCNTVVKRVRGRP